MMRKEDPILLIPPLFPLFPLPSGEGKIRGANLSGKGESNISFSLGFILEIFAFSISSSLSAAASSWREKEERGMVLFFRAGFALFRHSFTSRQRAEEAVVKNRPPRWSKRIMDGAPQIRSPFYPFSRLLEAREWKKPLPPPPPP